MILQARWYICFFLITSLGNCFCLSTEYKHTTICIKFIYHLIEDVLSLFSTTQRSYSLKFNSVYENWCSFTKINIVILKCIIFSYTPKPKYSPLPLKTTKKHCIYCCLNSLFFIFFTTIHQKCTAGSWSHDLRNLLISLKRWTITSG